ncbi:MAG TPA: PAS domain S-box protein, partial [Verrucomicrobiae bacterium]|nr:PAS domain S-box protein [Verrucomicrobiae bacterium]
MPAHKSSFLEKILGRLERLDKEGVQTIVQRLARERNFLETLFNTIEDGVLVTDEAGRVVYFNAAAAQLAGLPSEGVEGQPVTRFIPELDWSQLAAFDREGGQRVLRLELEVRYPRPRFLRLYAAPLDGRAAGGAGLALILHDATEARQKTFEAIESERIQALTLLAASVAHEIGNPLNALSIHLQLMEREIRKLKPNATAWTGVAGKRAARSKAVAQDAGEVAEAAGKLEGYLKVAKGEIDRLDYIITQFLQAIRPTPPRKQDSSLNDIVRETLALLGPELENRGIEVSEEPNPQLPHAPMDPGQIKQV